MYDTQITIFRWGYKPTNITGFPHAVLIHLIYSGTVAPSMGIWGPHPVVCHSKPTSFRGSLGHLVPHRCLKGSRHTALVAASCRVKLLDQREIDAGNIYVAVHKWGYPPTMAI